MLVQRMVVPFEGCGAGAGPLTWGQQQVWAAMVDIGSSLAMGGAVPVADSRTVADFAAELRFHMGRFPAMRTLLRFGDDGTVTQEVHATGRTVLEVHDATGGEDPATVAEALAAGWRERPFDYGAEWPLRMGVVRRDGAVTHVVALMCHIAADLGGVAVMMRELTETETEAGTGTEDRPRTALSPLELAEAQREPAMRRQTAAAMRHWEARLRAVPASLLGPPVDRGDPVFWRVCWQSRALHLASAAVSARLGADPAWVLLAAIATAFDRVVPGRGPFVALGIIGNRFRPALRDVVSPLAQDGLCVLDVAGTAPDEAIARARTASMSASKYAYYDPAARAELFERLGRERGEPVDLRVLYNDRRSGPPPATGGDPHAALAETCRTQEPVGFLGPKLMFHVEDVPDVVRLTVELDSRHLALADLHRLLDEVEAFGLTAWAGGAVALP